MITQINLRHFKCFDTLKLPLQRLTLLSGLNASGKSSVLQALVLLHQTIRSTNGPNGFCSMAWRFNLAPSGT